MSALVAHLLILTSVDGAPSVERDVSARVDQQVTLHVALRLREKRGCTLYTDAVNPRTRCRVKPFPAGASVRWYKVEPSRSAYDNTAGGGFSFAELEYDHRLWIEGPPSVRANVRSMVRPAGWSAGTMRYAVGASFSPSKGASSSKLDGRYKGGPAPKQDLRKVVLRLSDDYLGYLSELTNLPYIFGSAKRYGSHQAELGIGVDCADLAVYGLRRLGHPTEYVSSRTLGPLSRAVAGTIDARRGRRYLVNKSGVRVGAEGVQPGDWLIFPGHVGVFVKDKGELGWLDEDDLMFHTAWNEPRRESLADSGWGRYPFEVRRARVLAER